MENEPQFDKRKQSVDDLNERLYHKDAVFEQRKRRKIHGRDIDLEHDFEDDPKDILEKRSKRKLPTSFFKKIFLSVLGFFVVSAVLFGLSLYEAEQEVSAERISMEILGQPFVDGGELLELQIRIQNFNEQKLELPDLILSYPKDSKNDQDDVFLRRSLQDIAKGQRVSEEFDVVLFGQEGDLRNLHATLEYRIPGSSSIFVKEVDHEIVIRSTPTQVSISAPEEIVQNQEIELVIDIAGNSNKQINDILLELDYPLGFEFISSNLKPQFNSNTWYFSNITDEKETLTVVGTLSALPGEGQSFHARVGKQNNLQKSEIETVFNSFTHTVDVQQSFVTAELDLNGEGNKDVVIRGGDEIEVEVAYTNTLDKTLADVQIIAHLSGDLYTGEGIRVLNGEYDSNTHKITWDKNSLEALEFLEPGESGEFSFALQTNDLVDAKGALKNPTALISVDVYATEINGKVREAFGVSRAQVSANSDMSLVAKTLHNDGPFKNKGPLPPRVGEKTKYTLTFQVINSSNDVNEAQVSTFLPPYVDWLNAIAPSVERQKVEYNPTTREVIWNIGTLNSGTGIGTTLPKQVSFQVEALPSLTHVDENLPLTKDIILSGKDSFTDVKLSFKKSPLTTSLKAEPSAPSGAGRVVR